MDCLRLPPLAACRRLPWVRTTCSIAWLCLPSIAGSESVRPSREWHLAREQLPELDAVQSIGDGPAVAVGRTNSRVGEEGMLGSHNPLRGGGEARGCTEGEVTGSDDPVACAAGDNQAADDMVASTRSSCRHVRFSTRTGDGRAYGGWP